MVAMKAMTMTSSTTAKTTPIIRPKEPVTVGCGVEPVRDEGSTYEAKALDIQAYIRRLTWIGNQDMYIHLFHA